MRLGEFVLNFGCVLLSILVFGRADAYCGKYRWNVKILADQPTLKTERTTTVSYQNRLGRPTARDLRKGRHSSETYAYAVSGIVTAIGLEADNDIHVVLKDLHTSETIVCEIPDPSACKEVRATERASQYSEARKALQALFGPLRKGVKALSKTRRRQVTLHGVGFWDMLNHGGSHAKNGRELHPVLKVE